MKKKKPAKKAAKRGAQPPAARRQRSQKRRRQAPAAERAAPSDALPFVIGGMEVQASCVGFGSSLDSLGEDHGLELAEI